MNNTIRVNLLGGMSVEIGDRILLKGAGKINKFWKLLAYLAVNQSASVSTLRLMDILWSIEEDIANPQGALKNAVYCLRRELGNQDYILFSEGAYSWNRNYKLITDVAVLDEAFAALTEAQAYEEKLPIYKQIIELYKGDFLPQLSDEEWVIQRSAYYRKKYLASACEYLQLLFDNGQYDDILSVANNISFIEPYHEDVYLYLFKALYALNMNAVLVNTFFRVSRIFQDELGIELCSEIKELYANASKKVNKIEHDILIIKEDLREATKDQTPIRGPYFCSYETFKQMYQMVARAADRDNRAIVLLLITVQDPKGGIPENPILQNAMLELREILKNSLRKGDTFAQYSKAQYILMLATHSLEKAQIVIDRIEKKYNLYKKYNKIQLVFKVSLQSSITE